MRIEEPKPKVAAEDGEEGCKAGGDKAEGGEMEVRT